MLTCGNPLRTASPRERNGPSYTATDSRLPRCWLTPSRARYRAGLAAGRVTGIPTNSTVRVPASTRPCRKGSVGVSADSSLLTDCSVVAVAGDGYEHRPSDGAAGCGVNYPISRGGREFLDEPRGSDVGGDSMDKVSPRITGATRYAREPVRQARVVGAR